MANIDSKLDVIRTAERGENVRDAIIGAIRDINNDVPADMSNPEHIIIDMPPGSDKTVPFNPPKLVSEIYVKQPNTGGKSMTTPDITITENGEYPADDPSYDPDKELRYYSKVTVKVPQLANAVLDLEEEITQNGTYSAPADWGVDGIRTFTVNVNAATGDGPFQVEFYDKVQSDPTAAVKETQLVPKGGSATTSYQPVSPTGQIFTGWNPDPVNVTRDMKCYPRFTDKQIVIGEIMDNWDVICANKGGDKYPLGSYKNMPFSYTWKLSDMLNIIPDWSDHPDVQQYPNSTMTLTADFIMFKVATGEQGTTSTWLSRPTGSLLISSEGGSGRKLIGNPWGGYPGYDGSVVDKFLEHIFYQSMADIFKQSIVGVNKYQQVLDPARTNPPYNMTVINRHVWIPSIKEIITTGDIGGGTNNTNLYIPISAPTSGNFQLNKEIFVDNVMGGVAYFRDVLGLDIDQFITAMYADQMPFSLRDSYTHDTGHTGWYYPCCPTDGRRIVDYNCRDGYHLNGNLMIGFCMG